MPRTLSRTEALHLLPPIMDMESQIARRFSVDAVLNVEVYADGRVDLHLKATGSRMGVIAAYRWWHNARQDFARTGASLAI